MEIQQALQKQFDKMCATGMLFRSNILGEAVWLAYINAFEEDPIFRDPDSSVHNCNLCKNFLRRYGNIIAVDKNYDIITMWDFDLDKSSEYYPVVRSLQNWLAKSEIKEVFFETFAELNSLPYGKTSKNDKTFRLGVDKNHKRYTKEEAEKFGKVKPNQIETFTHLHLDLPAAFVSKSTGSIEAIMAAYRSSKEVFKRALDEISVDTLKLVKDLAAQGSLLDIDAHIKKIDAFIPFMQEYSKIPEGKRNAYAWVKSYDLPIAKFRNELLGVLCVELSEGKELNAAVLAWNKRVSPDNYMKATAPITKRQIEEAAKFVEDNGYSESFDRRFATIDDISVSEILHSNVGNATIKTAGLFDKVKPSTSSRHKRSEFEGVEEVGIEKFMRDILPNCSAVEVFLTANQERNLVSLTTANNPDSKPIFKWSNNFSWTFNGNLAGQSQLAKMVEAKGGRVDGVFRFTHSWNEIEPNQSLMDLHVFMPGCTVPTSGGGPNVKGRRVGWNNRKDTASGGVQDVDYTSEAPQGYIPVENITFPDISKMPEGVYTCCVHNWNFRRTGGRGKAEIAIGGEVYQYIYPATKHHQWVPIAEVTLKNGQFTIEHKIEPSDGFGAQKEMYGLQSNQFHKVNLVCLTPNHWGDNNVGNKHYLFMLEGAKCPNAIRSFHAENLIPELAAHRKVLEVLGNTTQIEPTTKQLSGLGFNATVRDEVILKLSGNFKRVIKIKI